MDGVRYPVVELRQYRLRPGQREVLIELFDREFVESQEAEGMAVVGQFRDLDDPDRFVWIRGFASMPARARALAGFYGGPAWKANSAAANATMLDTDDVLLLRPVSAQAGFPVPAAAAVGRRRRPGRTVSHPGHALLRRPPVRFLVHRLLRPARPPGADRDRRPADRPAAHGVRGEHVPGAARAHRRARLRLAGPVREPGRPRPACRPAAAIRAVARQRPARAVGAAHQGAPAAAAGAHRQIPAALTATGRLQHERADRRPGVRPAGSRRAAPG